KRSTPQSRIVATSERLERVTDPYKAGIEHLRARRFFEAHEELELAWRAADDDERDFYQGLVHVAVAWYQAGRGNRVGTERQLEKALRRLARYEPAHGGLDVAALRVQLVNAQAIVAAGSLEPPPPELVTAS